MNKFSALAAFVLACATAQAAAPRSMIAEGADGVAAILHFDAGLCMGDAKRAEFIQPRAPTIPGCWKVLDPLTVQIIFLDGDYMKLPINRFKTQQAM